MTRLLRPFLPLALGVGVATACVQVYPPPATGPAPAPAAAAQPDTTEKEGDTPFEEWDEVLEDTEAIEGYFTFHQKRDRTLFLEIPADRLDEEFGLVMHISRGVGDFNIQQGLPLSDARLMQFERVGDKVYLLHKNPRFTADEGTRMRRALDENIGHSVVAAFDIKSQHEESENLLVDVTRFLVSDYPNIAMWLGFYYGQAGVTFDGNRSRVERVLGFPENVEIDAFLTYQSGSPPRFGGFGLSDWRSVPVGVRYSIFALPEEPMVARLGDDRVGHFLTARWDFSRDDAPEPWVRYVSRWRLEKANPEAAISEPVEPIVFYVDRSVPDRYRQYVREGIEGWNRAFEAAGFRNAIVAKDPPEEDESWSAEDIRYSTVRWTPGYNMGFAIGPSQADPRTGEILNSDILISSSFVRSWQLGYQNIVGTEEHNFVERYREAERLQRELPPHLAERICLAEFGKAHEMAFGYTVLAALGEVPVGEMPDDYLGDAIRDLVMHEMGHSLGLRHNFKASSGVPHDRLHDSEFTGEHGVSLSVMDYTPVNVSPDRDRQGHYWNKTVGTYDVWAIRYAYEPIYEETVEASSDASAAAGSGSEAGTAVRSIIRDPYEELPGLRKIASEVADPKHAYGTDEDNWLGSFAVDPLTNAWDLGSDPLAHARDRATLVADVKPRLEERLVAEGDRYYRLRTATTSLIFERFRTLMPVTKKVGGLYFHRDRRGDPGARDPFVMVPLDRQREAVRFIVEQAFEEDSFRFDPELLNKLAPNRFSHWGTGFVTLPVDYPLSSYVLMVQRSLLEELLAPPRLWRMIDNEARVAGGTEAYRASELFATLSAAIWSELGASGAARPVGLFRRNLQRAHTEQLVDLLMDTPGGFPTATTPEDGRSLARRELRQVSERIERALGSDGPDDMTRAHLEESKARIDRALEASLQLSPRVP